MKIHRGKRRKYQRTNGHKGKGGTKEQQRETMGEQGQKASKRLAQDNPKPNKRETNGNKGRHREGRKTKRTQGVHKGKANEKQKECRREERQTNEYKGKQRKPMI